MQRLEALRRKRLVTFLVSLCYFAALLAVGVLVFLMDIPHAWLLVAACVAGYLLLVRPALSRYKNALRGEILSCTVGVQLTGYSHEPKSGTSMERLVNTGLVPVPLGALHSRELIRGRAGQIEAELADVTFPIRENNLNAMFSGCYLGLVCPGASFAPCRVEAGKLEGLSLPKKQRELMEKLGAAIPGCLYLHMEGERLDILLRGRFLGFSINPLMPVTKQTLTASPLPELDFALQLARLRSV